MQQDPKQLKSEEKNMMLAMVIIIVVLMLFQYLNPRKPQPEMDQSVVNSEKVEVVAQEKPILPIAVASKTDKTFSVENQFVKGSLFGDGSGMGNLVLSTYKENLTPDSPAVQLLSDKYS